ncbi:adenine phosphoribosyltransferase [Roseiconus nitratireducens]|uniref:Adenine phosphoribosyltransferase n=1 Tax=Roseiconus nitratireducens TaxID=2605748 RepID=A0A5M6D811_9BACT|nr:adenine phosphoribosyltransferase [Roseiconus nitratireducens]KAA5543671.1 adenine phosphoribosyltransferase [Roseiconus nitratireducens]
MTVDLKSLVRDIPDFPKPGIIFRDIAPLLLSPEALHVATEAMAAPFENESVDLVAAVEARGFLFAAPLAMRLGAGVVPIRKPGKLPFETHAHSYDLEYGSDELHIHIDGVLPGQRVIVADDLLATGGTMQACCKLLEKCQAEIVACSFLIHLSDLQGEKRLAPHRVESVLVY